MNALGNKRLVICGCNRVAVAAATTLATHDLPPFSTLFIQGPSGSGKTHILRAIEAMHRAIQPQATRMLLNAGELMRWPNKVNEDELHGIDLLLIDDLDVVAKSGITQENLVHIIDTIERLAKGRVAMTSSLTTRDLSGISPRLMSRLYAAAGVDIGRPDEAMRADMLRAELEQWQEVRISGSLIASLAERLPSDGHIIAGAAKRIALHVQATGLEPDESVVLAMLHNSINLTPRIAVSLIQTHTAKHFHIPAREMTSDRRAREVARPRQVSMYLCKLLTPKSLPDIGNLHGGRDHTTVIHAVKQIEKLRAVDGDLDSSIRVIERELTH
jgi:chromosomal replication initiator protein